MSAVERVHQALERRRAAAREELWIAVREPAELLAEAEKVERRAHDGERLPLAGLKVAVKDNIDVAGLPTTAACPAYSRRAHADAVCVARLRAAGAIVVGKTNMDQFATGLVGTRSPHGPVRDARRPDYVSGGSSSGSAVAVAMGMADLGLATDTAGSGRVPAAFQGIIGIKPTPGVVPTAGLVPACRSYDCVALFSRQLAPGLAAVALMGAPPRRRWPAYAPRGAPPRATIAVPRCLPDLTPSARVAFAAAAERFAGAGHELVEVDIKPWLQAGRLLYGGALVAERYAAVGPFIETHPGSVDESVRSIVLAAKAILGHALAVDQAQLQSLRRQMDEELAATDALLLPTTTRQPRISDVAQDPIAVNARLGTYTAAANLLDRCAVALPAGRADGGHFGVTLTGPAFHDGVLADLAQEFLAGARSASPPPLASEGHTLFVVGAHRSGMPLNHELTARGARLSARVRTAAEYRLHRLALDPPRPGLVRVDREGCAIDGELWVLPPGAIGDLLAELPPPLTLGSVRLDDGSRSTGFLCEAAGLPGSEDITRFGSWPAYLAAAAPVSA